MGQGVHQGPVFLRLATSHRNSWRNPASSFEFFRALPRPRKEIREPTVSPSRSCVTTSSLAPSGRSLAVNFRILRQSFRFLLSLLVPSCRARLGRRPSSIGLVYPSGRSGPAQTLLEKLLPLLPLQAELKLAIATAPKANGKKHSPTDCKKKTGERDQQSTEAVFHCNRISLRCRLASSRYLPAGSSDDQG